MDDYCIVINNIIASKSCIVSIKSIISKTLIKMCGLGYGEYEIWANGHNVLWRTS